jgi:hypothetical protein
MGINAQTSVPKFTAGDTLTAANTNLLANGIPVFAGTATRDAAFDGAGEKALAEGQYAYLEDTNATQFYDGAAWQPLGGGEAAISFTPTWNSGYTRGNGTTVAYYMSVNKLIYLYIEETLGTTSAVTGALGLTLPVNASRQQAIQMGRSRIDDTGANVYWGTTVGISSSAVIVYADLASGTYSAFAGISATIPMTWAATDKFTLSFVYEAA